MSGSLGTAALVNVGVDTGQVITSPAPMSVVPTIKTPIDKILLNLDSAAYHPAADFATPSQIAALTPKATTINGHPLTTNVSVTAADLGLGSLTNIRERRIFMLKTLVGVNALLSDIAVFPAMPSLYCIEGLRVFSPSISLATVAKLAMFTGPNGTGTAVITSALISCALNAWNDMAIVAGVRNATVSHQTLYVQNSVPLGVPATCSLLLTILDLSP